MRLQGLECSDSASSIRGSGPMYLLKFPSLCNFQLHQYDLRYDPLTKLTRGVSKLIGMPSVPLLERQCTMLNIHNEQGIAVAVICSIYHKMAPNCSNGLAID